MSIVKQNGKFECLYSGFSISNVWQMPVCLIMYRKPTEKESSSLFAILRPKYISTLVRKRQENNKKL